MKATREFDKIIAASVEAFAEEEGRRTNACWSPRWARTATIEERRSSQRRLPTSASTVLVGPLFQTPEEAVAEAIASEVDLIGVSSHAAGHLTLVPQLTQALEAEGAASSITVILWWCHPAEGLRRAVRPRRGCDLWSGHQHSRGGRRGHRTRPQEQDRSFRMTDRPFKILGLQQDCHRRPRPWCATRPVGRHARRREGRRVRIRVRERPRGHPFGRVWRTRRRDRPDGAARSRQSPQGARASAHHIGLWVDDLPAAVNWLEANGMRFTPGGIRTGASGHDICFVHPKGNDEFPISGEGVLIELVQAPAELLNV